MLRKLAAIPHMQLHTEVKKYKSSNTHAHIHNMSMVEPTSNTTGYPQGLSADGHKIDIIARDPNDASCVTFCIHGEDHTLGNALRYIIMKNPDVEFCGYTIPHPSEFKLHLRIQTNGNISAPDALDKGLLDLVDLCNVVKAKFSTETGVTLPEN